MDGNTDTHFERVEKALASLVESVAKYHPSAKQAQDLQVADKELSQGLEDVEKHQKYYMNLQQLRETCSTLDSQIRSTLSSLASTRKDITTTHITVRQESSKHPIKYDELLNYARRISKTTLPPAGVTNGVLWEGETGEASAPADASNGLLNGAQSGGAVHNAAQTPAASAQSHDMASGANGRSSQPLISPDGPEQAPESMSKGLSHANLPDGLRNVLNPHFGASFIPWPNEYQIGGGALVAVQDLTNRGINPKGHDPVAVAAEAKRKEEAEKAAREEKERLKREEDRRRREEWEANNAKRLALEAQQKEALAASGAATNSGAAKNAQFHFTSMDLGDDDDD